MSAHTQDLALTTRLLGEDTFDDFARAVEKNKIWGGCWCLGFHGTETTRDDKHRRVREGSAHAALVYDGDRVVGWCQYGRRDELPGIKHRRQYEAEAEPGAEGPDWRITCFVVDREYRRRGVARRALEAAVDQIRSEGGGRVERYPEDTEGRRVSSSFLYNATLALFEDLGFSRTRRLGKDHWVVTRTV